MKDLKIVNASIADFEKGDFTSGDILIHNGKIEKIGNVTEETKKTIDAKGQVATPGFIDLHAHEDKFFSGEFGFFTAKCSLRMGVTTQAVGNCGSTYNDIEVFIAATAKGSPLNYLTFIGQNTLREMVGVTDRYAGTPKNKILEMQKILADHKKYGIIGLSSGLEYAPGVTTEETIELLKALGDGHYLNAAHFREDGEGSAPSVNELAYISKETGYAMQMSHIGSCSALGNNMVGAIKALKAARSDGIDITVDCYPYEAFATGIGTAVFDEGCFEKWGKSYHDIMPVDGEYKNERCTKEIFEHIKKTSPNTTVVAFVMNESEIIRAYKEPYVYVASDCGYYNGCGHPRGAGTFPRALGRYSRELGEFSLIEMLEKMTMLPAKRLRLSSKGEIKEGFDGDIVIFDKDKIADKADFINQAVPPEGISYVIVNGNVAVENNVIVCENSGSYIKYQAM